MPRLSSRRRGNGAPPREDRGARSARPRCLRGSNRPDGRNPPRSASSKPMAAVRVTEVHRSSERWDSTSNGRIDSISSPKNSMRTGSVASVGKTSRIPPLDAEFSGHLHDFSARHAALEHPGRQDFDGQRPGRRRRCGPSLRAIPVSEPAGASLETARPPGAAGCCSKAVSARASAGRRLRRRQSARAAAFPTRERRRARCRQTSPHRRGSRRRRRRGRAGSRASWGHAGKCGGGQGRRRAPGPSRVALRPFLSAASISRKPGAR